MLLNRIVSFLAFKELQLVQNDHLSEMLYKGFHGTVWKSR